MLIFEKYFWSCCFQLIYILILLLNLYKDTFCKVDLFAPLLGDIEAIILCSFDFDLKKKKIRPPVRPPLLKKSCGGQPNNYFLCLMKNKLKWKVRLFHINNSNDSVYLFLNHNHILLLKSACTTRKAAQLITFDKFKNNVFLHVQMYAKIMIFCTKSARKIAEFQACIKLSKFYILMLHLPSGPMLGNSLYSFHKCFTVQHAIWLWVSLADHCVLVYMPFVTTISWMITSFVCYRYSYFIN